MLEAAGITASALTMVLDVGDKLIKLAAVCMGGLWTWWNYRKSRTYKQRMELQIKGEIIERGSVYCEVGLTIRNLSATRHTVQERGSYLEVTAIDLDLNEKILAVIPAFAEDHSLEPGETRKDVILIVLPIKREEIFRVRLLLHVESQGVVWFERDMIRLSDHESQ